MELRASPWRSSATKIQSNWIYGAHSIAVNFIIIPMHYKQIYIFTHFQLCFFVCSIFARPPLSFIPSNKISSILLLLLLHMQTFPHNLCTSNLNQFSSTINRTEATTAEMGLLYPTISANCKVN